MLICVGEILVDVFIDNQKETSLPGGAPFNVACNALLYTKDVSFVGAIGNDDNGRMLLEFISGKPFKATHIKTLEDRYTTRAIVTLDNGERSFRFDRELGADYCLDIKDIDIGSINDNDIVHIGSLMLSTKEGVAFFNDLVHSIRASSKAKISFDINYRDDIFSSPDEAKAIFIDALKQADILKFSIDELELLANEKDVSKALSSLLNPNQVAVITLGKDGSIFYKDNRLIEVSSIPIKPVDTTGAGDAFYSYFLSSLVNDSSLINDEEKIIDCLRKANVVGALATQKKGAIGVAPSIEQLNEILKKN